MDLRQMRYFLAVVEHGGITQAARELYISQPSLSQSIRNLEAELQRSLFQRAGRTLQPTPEGLAFAESLRRILKIADDGVARVRRVTDLEAGRLTIATSSTFGVHPVVEWVAAFLSQHPRLEIYLKEHGTTAQAASALTRGHCDLAVLEPPTTGSSVLLQPWQSEELLVAGTVPPLDRFGDRIPAGEIAAIPFGIISREQTGHSPSMEAMARLLGTIRVSSANRLLLWELVADGVIATFIPARAAAIVMPGVPLRHVDPPLTREVAIAYRSGQPPAAVKAFLTLVSTIRERTRSTKASPAPDRVSGS